MRFSIIAVAIFSTLAVLLSAEPESATHQAHVVELGLPTDNDAIFRGDGPGFYQYIERDYHGEKSYPWEGGQYGFVRDPEQTAAGIVYTRFHEGIDIRPMQRDENGEPLDEVRAIADGKVVYTNPTPSYSNYGKYIVIEHQWDGSPYYSLYGHLSVIQVRVGQSVQRGDRIATMGYTGAGINRERAHTHLELNLMLSHHFNDWYNHNYTDEPNHHGLYNGINLTGLDIARLYLALRAKPSLTIPQFLAEEEVYYKVALPHSRFFELPKNYPWMVTGNEGTAAKSWLVSFARSGFPLKIEPNEKKVKHPELVWVKPSRLDARYLTNDVAEGPTSHPHFSDYGKQLVELLIWPD